MAKEEKEEIGDMKTLGLGLLGKLFIKKINKFVEDGARDWDCEPEDIVMQMKIFNGEPVIQIVETKWGKRSMNILEQMSSMEAIVNVMFKKLLRSNVYMAKKWGIPEEKVRSDLKMIKRQPELRIVEEGGKRFLDMEIV